MMSPQTEAILPKPLKRVGIAADHGGFELKQFLAEKLREAGFEVTDFGDRQLKSDDDYPDFIIPLARAIAAGTVDRGGGICGSGVGASIAANKVAGVRAGLIDENFSAHQGVEDDDLKHGAVPVPLAARRKEFHGPLIVANGFTYAKATQALAEDMADAVAFGRLFIANPDLPERFRLDAPLNALEDATLYGGASKGYTDYPAMGPQLVER